MATRRLSSKRTVQAQRNLQQFSNQHDRWPEFFGMCVGLKLLDRVRMQKQPQQIMKILVVGQTPPPFGGQAIMIERMLEETYPGVELKHVRMTFSDEMSDIGRLQIRKIIRMLIILFKIWKSALIWKPDALYYPPAGPDLVPFIRDVFLLLLTRPLFKKRIFQFHASGVSELLPRIGPLGRLAYRCAYGTPDLTIGMTPLAPPDAESMRSRKHVIVPYGIPDATNWVSEARPTKVGYGGAFQILFVGVISKGKGAMTLLNACAQLAESGISFHCNFVGKFESPDFELLCKEFVATNRLQTHVHFAGVLTGDAKWAAYRTADLFCFPSKFNAESFPVVLIEAAMFGLPSVASNWKGIPGIVQQGRTGLLVPPEDPRATSDAIASLINNPGMLTEMGRNARKQYLEQFTVDIFYEKMGRAFHEILN
jgi:glycosyltransferase involved in cell wall biosynthesis